MSGVFSGKKETVKKEIIKWHSMLQDAVFKYLETDEKGLNDASASERMEKYGPNSLPEKKIPSLFIIFIKQFLSPLIYVLIAAAVASILIGDMKDAIFIILVIMINAIIGTYQEYGAEKSAAALQNMIKVKARVLRNGEKIEIDSRELVPGDIVYLESGDKVPADMMVLDVNNFEVDESFLTGESVAVMKKTGVMEENAGVSDRKNITFAGSAVTKGRCKGVVVETGLSTEVGRIAESLSGEHGAKAPLIIRMEKFSKDVSIAVLICCGIVAAVLMMNGQPAANVFFLAVALAVSAIPEGLPVALTVALSVATQRMSKRNVIVRRLTAVESLGSCTMIASDKTGTLTVNQQTVKEIVIPDGTCLLVEGQGYNSEGSIKTCSDENAENIMESDSGKLIKYGMICNEAVFKKKDDKWETRGDAMDIAFLALSEKAGFNSNAERSELNVKGDIPYESEKKYAARFFEDKGKTVVAVKGALETVSEFCTKMADGKGGVVPMDRKKIEDQALALAEKGLRVLAVAGGETQGTSENDLRELVFSGLAGFIDPLRQESLEAVKKCEKAGVQVAMVTGDHPATAFSIAKELGICETKEEVVTGADLEKISDPEGDEFMELVRKTKVFARVSPIQKLQIVGALNRAGHFVAVTGDGVNDAPALKKANIGVAMGSGTDVAKDTGNMIVTDDNFASIVAGIEEGRFAFDNVRKVIYLLISTGAAEIVLFLLAVTFTFGFFDTGIEAPLMAIQLLWLNLVTNGIQGAALAFEGGEEGTMKKPPRNPKEPIFNALMLQQSLISGFFMAIPAFGVWYYLASQGMAASDARNIVLLMMVLLENVHVFNCRSETVSAFRVKISKNYFLIFGVIVAQSIHVISMQIPFMQELLQIHPVTLKQWGLVAMFSLTLLLAMEIFKFIRSRVYPKIEYGG